MEQALAYVCCSAEESRVKVQKYCRKIYELGYVPICPRFVFSPFLEESDAEVLEVEEADGDQSGNTGADTGEDAVSKRHHRRGKLV